MKLRHFSISLFFLSIAVTVCAKSEAVKVEASSMLVKNNNSPFSSRKLIPNDQNIDIDGDGRIDSIELVSIFKDVNVLPQSIALITPWPLVGETTEKSHQFKNGSHNNILVSLSNSKQFLVHDFNAVSLLDTEAANEIFTLAKSSLSELELPELSERAKGGVIVIPTEAGIDIYLYWDGSTFQTYEPMESP